MSAVNASVKESKSIEVSNEVTLHQGALLRKKAEMEKDTVTPCRGELRKRAHDQLSMA